MILVTGGAGFIGSNIVAGLNEQGRSDILISDWLGSEDKWRNLARHSFSDFVNPSQLDNWLDSGKKLDAVIHMGAISATTAVDGDEIIRCNFQLSLRLLDLCTERGIPFLYASSAATYGDATKYFVDDISPEAVRALNPLNLYGWSKQKFDLVVAERLSRGEKLPPRFAGFRFFNVFGPNEYHKGDMKSVIAKIYPIASRGETVTLFKSHREGIRDGEQSRDFVYVKDAVSVVLWALGPNGRSGIFNVGTGQARSFRDLARAVFSALGMPERIQYVDMPEAIREKYQYFTQASLSHLRQAGYSKPFASLESAVDDYVRNYLQKPDPYL